VQSISKFRFFITGALTMYMYISYMRYMSKASKARPYKKIGSSLDNIPSMFDTQKTRSEEKYTERIFTIPSPDQADRILSAFGKFCQIEGVQGQNMKYCRFIKPSEAKRQEVYLERKQKFNRIVGEKIKEIVNVHYNKT
jgi:hypothetical protein